MPLAMKESRDHVVSPPPDYRLLARLSHNRKAELNPEVAELFDALHLECLDDVWRLFHSIGGTSTGLS
jgi:hypothetical protein